MTRAFASHRYFDFFVGASVYMHYGRRREFRRCDARIFAPFA